MSSSPSRGTPTQVQIGWWCGMYFSKLRTIAARASSLIGTWYELTRKTWLQPWPPASFRLCSTFAKAWSICWLISRKISPVSRSQPPYFSRRDWNQHFEGRRPVHLKASNEQPTLSCTFDAVTNANSLAVLELLAVSLANAFVAKILKVGHDERFFFFLFLFQGVRHVD